MSLWIKICGNTSLEDALLSAEAGADAVGFVFAPSPRQVTIQQVSAIVPHLPGHLEKIGVFVDATLDEIDATVRACGLTGIQLHFDAGPELPTQLRERFGTNLRIVGVVRCPTLAGVSENPQTECSSSRHRSWTNIRMQFWSIHIPSQLEAERGKPSIGVLQRSLSSQIPRSAKLQPAA